MININKISSKPTKLKKMASSSSAAAIDPREIEARIRAEMERVATPLLFDKDYMDTPDTSSPPIENADLWEVAQSFFDHYGIAYHQIASYNEALRLFNCVIENNKLIQVEVPFMSQKDPTYTFISSEERWVVEVKGKDVWFSGVANGKTQRRRKLRTSDLKSGSDKVFKFAIPFDEQPHLQQIVVQMMERLLHKNSVDEWIRQGDYRVEGNQLTYSAKYPSRFGDKGQSYFYADMDIIDHIAYTFPTSSPEDEGSAEDDEEIKFNPYRALDFPKQHYTVEFGNLIFDYPKILEKDGETPPVSPKECIDRAISYTSNMYVTVELENPFGERRVYQYVPLGSVPVMVKSNICNIHHLRDDWGRLAELGENIHDPGGYFLCRSSTTGNIAPKIIAFHDHTAPNRIYIFAKSKTVPAFELNAEVRSTAISGAHSTRVQVGIQKKNGLLSVSLPYIENCSIPLAIVFIALGVPTPKEMLEYITFDLSDRELVELLEQSFNICLECRSRDMALLYIGMRGKKYTSGRGKLRMTEAEKEQARLDAISYTLHLLENELFPHLGKSFIKKRFFLGMMVNKLLCVKLGRTTLEDRDHFANKRVATPRDLFSQAFYNGYKRLCNDIRKSIKRCIDTHSAVNIVPIVAAKAKGITNKLVSVLISKTTGKAAQQSAAQTYDTFNHLASLANIRKLLTPMSTEGGKIEGPRDLHGSQWGIICPFETSEGKKCLTLDTSILTPDGEVPLGELKNGDSVITVNPFTFECTTTTIYEYFTIIASPIYEVELAVGIVIRGTADHPLLSSGRRWIEIGQLSLGDQIYAIKESITHLTSITRIEQIAPLGGEGVMVADFTTVSENHSFVANGIITHNCGLSKHSALESVVTVGSDPREVLQLIQTMDIIPFEVIAASKGRLLEKTKIFVNGDAIGITEKPQLLLQSLRRLRRSGSLNPEVSISMDVKTNEIHVSTEGGRLCRPLLIVEKGEILLRKKDLPDYKGKGRDEGVGSSWTRLLTGGFIELLDKAEEDSQEILIITFPEELQSKSDEDRLDYTHCELPPALLMGVGATRVPYPEHDQSPRVVYQAAMGKQAIGIPGTNFIHHSRGTAHVMMYPQRPLTSSRVAKMIGLDDLPTGQNAIVAITPWLGLNQEDAIILNKDSVDRGMFTDLVHYAYIGKIKEEKSERFAIPTREDCSNFKGNPSKLDENGIIRSITDDTKTRVSKGDILIGRTIEVDPSLSVHRQRKKNISIYYEHEWDGVVEKIHHGYDGEGYEYYTVVVVQMRRPIVGDKFSALHGQKGVAGAILPAIDLPTTVDGITPDIVVNPAAIPSRMTIGMMIEMMCGTKICASSHLNQLDVKKAFCLDKDIDPSGGLDDKKGCTPPLEGYSAIKSDGDATPFDRAYSLRNIVKELRRLGLNGFGDRLMYNGMTGESMRCLIFMGTCYYQRLKHEVVDKAHARSRGGRTTLVRQPTEGRKRGGGFKIGNMERDALLGQGAAWFVKDRMMDQSDFYQMWFCSLCGLPALVTAGIPGAGIAPTKECRLCDSMKVSLVELPYAAKLVMQEFAAMNIVMRVITLPFEGGDSIGIEVGGKIKFRGRVVKRQK